MDPLTIINPVHFSSKKNSPIPGTGETDGRLPPVS